VKTVKAILPALVGFGYLRLLVMGRPPHFKGDLCATLLSLRLDFTDPPLRIFPLVPRLWIDGAAAAGPARPADQRHPARAGAVPQG